MNLWSRIREAFGGKPALRNKPGGMAYINSRIDEGDGTAALVNRIVRTVRISEKGFWEIDPPQLYTCTRGARNVHSGHVARPGDMMRTFAIADECLTPLQGDVSPAEVRELYAPKREKETV